MTSSQPTDKSAVIYSSAKETLAATYGELLDTVNEKVYNRFRKVIVNPPVVKVDKHIPKDILDWFTIHVYDTNVRAKTSTVVRPAITDLTVEPPKKRRLTEANGELEKSQSMNGKNDEIGGNISQEISDLTESDLSVEMAKEAILEEDTSTLVIDNSIFQASTDSMSDTNGENYNGDKNGMISADLEPEFVVTPDEDSDGEPDLNKNQSDTQSTKQSEAPNEAQSEPPSANLSEKPNGQSTNVLNVEQPIEKSNDQQTDKPAEKPNDQPIDEQFEIQIDKLLDDQIEGFEDDIDEAPYDKSIDKLMADLFEKQNDLVPKMVVAEPVNREPEELPKPRIESNLQLSEESSNDSATQDDKREEENKEIMAKLISFVLEAPDSDKSPSEPEVVESEQKSVQSPPQIQQGPGPGPGPEPEPEPEPKPAPVPAPEPEPEPEPAPGPRSPPEVVQEVNDNESNSEPKEPEDNKPETNNPEEPETSKPEEPETNNPEEPEISKPEDIEISRPAGVEISGPQLSEESSNDSTEADKKDTENEEKLKSSKSNFNCLSELQDENDLLDFEDI